jgi:hypothetical protein
MFLSNVIHRTDSSCRRVLPSPLVNQTHAAQRNTANIRAQAIQQRLTHIVVKARRELLSWRNELRNNSCPMLSLATRGDTCRLRRPRRNLRTELVVHTYLHILPLNAFQHRHFARCSLQYLCTSLLHHNQHPQYCHPKTELLTHETRPSLLFPMQQPRFRARYPKPECGEAGVSVLTVRARYVFCACMQCKLPSWTCYGGVRFLREIEEEGSGCGRLRSDAVLCHVSVRPSFPRSTGTWSVVRAIVAFRRYAAHVLPTAV